MPEHELAIMFNTAQLAPGFDQAATEQFEPGLATHLGKTVEMMSKGIQTFQGGGWEVVSHAVTPLGHRVVVSLLLRREKG